MYKQKIVQLTFFLFPIFFLAGCAGNQASKQDDARVRVPVTVTSPRVKPLAEYLELFATSRFQNKSNISAPVTGYVEDVFFQPGDNVSIGAEVFRLKTREAQALQNNTPDQYQFSGIVPVKASMDGMLITLDHAKGDFVMEGEPLGTISLLSSLAFFLDVPFEDAGFVKVNSMCNILMPDGDSVPGRIISRLPSMSAGSQTQQFLVKPRDYHNIPENLIAKIRVVREARPGATVLPQSCVLADEIMKHYWVMKMINDSVAVRVDVVTGLNDGKDVEIIKPVLNPDDIFLASGNYGLGDTIVVRVKGIMNE